MTALEIIETYYDEVTEQLYPDWYDNEDYEEELLPAGYQSYFIWGIYQAKPEYDDILSANGFQEVYLIMREGGYDNKFIAITDKYKLYDVTSEIDEILSYDEEDEDEQDWSEDAMIKHGAALYDAYGPDVDTSDMISYDAACYLAYLRDIGKI